MMRALLLLVAATSSALAAPPVTSLAYKSDQSLLAAGSSGVVYLIDPAKGTILAELPGQSDRVTALAFDSDSLLAVASGKPSESGIVRIYQISSMNTRSAKEIASFTAHPDLLYAMCFSPDGRTLATAGYDRTIKLWNLPIGKTPKPSFTLTDHSDTVYALAFHPDGKHLASGSADRTVKLWDITTGKRLHTLSDSTDWVYAVAWNQAGTRLAAGGVDRSIRIWGVNAEGGELLASAFAHEKSVTHLAFSKSGDSVYSVGEDRVVKVWDAVKLTERKAYPAVDDTILSFARSPDDRQIALGCFDGVLQILDAKTGKPISTPLPIKPKPPSVKALSPDAARRGVTTRITITGANLTDVTALKANGSGITADIIPQSKTANRLEVEVTLPATLKPGVIQLTLVSPAGESVPVPFHVDRFTAIAEQGRTDSVRDAMPVSLPATVVGVLDRAGDVDYFSFQAKAGEEIGAQFQSGLDRLKFNPVLFLSDESGEVVATGRNGLLGYQCPNAGRYSIAVQDVDYRGGADFRYRLHIGNVPILTSVFPLGVTRRTETSVTLTGVNLARRMMTVSPPDDAEPGSLIPLPRGEQDRERLGNIQLTVGAFPSQVMPKSGETALSNVPGTVDGVMMQPGKPHLVRFHATKGTRLVIETEAARFGSPLDSRLEILDSTGKPVPQHTLRCVARTFVTFRDHDSQKPGIRLDAWNELGVDDLLFVNGEVMRIHSLPRGPDDDCRFYSADGKRLAFLGTTPTHHALNTTVYKVEVHPPDASFPPNGMPIFRLPYRNDDGGPGFGKDSRIFFDPPADGEYQVRIVDANGAGGHANSYRLTVRPPKPDFAIRVKPNSPQVWENGAVPITITADRLDGYTGAIDLRFDGVTAPFTIPPTRIEADQETTTTAIVNKGAVKGKLNPIRVIGAATIDGKTIIHEADLGVPRTQPNGDLTASVNLDTLSIHPNTEARLTVTIERQPGFNGRVPVEVLGLPHGVRVLNVGLNGILITPNLTKREVVLYAEPWVKPGTTPIVIIARSERKQSIHAARPVMLTVE